MKVFVLMSKHILCWIIIRRFIFPGTTYTHSRWMSQFSMELRSVMTSSGRKITNLFILLAVIYPLGYMLDMLPICLKRSQYLFE